MTTRWPRRGRQLVMGVAAVALAGLSVASPASSARLVPRQTTPPTASQGPGPEPRLSLLSQTPWVEPTGTWTAQVNVTNTQPGMTISTTLYAALPSRAAFERSLYDVNLGRALTTEPTISVDDQVAFPNNSHLVTISIPLRNGGNGPANGLNLTQFGVNPVEIVLHAATGRPMAHLVTHLVRLPDASSTNSNSNKPLLTSLILPVSAPTLLNANGTYPISGGDQPELQALAAALALHPRVPVTVIPRAETFDGLRNLLAGSGNDLLGLLHNAIGSQDQVLAGFYVDLDQPAWVKAGLQDEILRERAREVASITDHLGRDADVTTQVVPDNATPASLADLQIRGASRFIIPEVSLQPLDHSARRETLTRPFEMTVGTAQATGLSIDEGLRSAFTRTPDDPTLEAHQLLAELALIYAAEAQSPRGVVLMAPAGATLSPEFLTTLLDGLQGAPNLITPATVGSLFDQLPTADRSGGGSTSGPRLTRTLADNAVASLGPFPAELARARGQLSSYESMLTGPSPDTADLDTRLLVASASDLSSNDRLSRVRGVADTAASRLRGIVAPGNQTVTLTAADAALPLTLQNNLDAPVVITLDLRANARLEFPELKGTRHAPCNLPGPMLRCTLPARSRSRISLRVHTKGSGVTPLTVTVRTADGRVLATATYKVQSTAVSGVGLLITAGAALFLIIWWARHWRRDRQARADVTEKPTDGSKARSSYEN